MVKSAGKLNSEGLVKLGIRVPPEVAVEFDQVRGRDSQAKAGLDAIILWMALDRDVRSILGGRHPLEEKRKYAAEIAAHLMRPAPADVVRETQERLQVRKRKPRRNNA